MNRDMKLGMLLLIILFQALTIVGIFYAYGQLSNMHGKLALDYKKLYEETHGVIIDHGILLNSFSPFILLLFLSLSLTIAIIIDEIRQKKKS
jgi:hypothetical protein